MENLETIVCPFCNAQIPANARKCQYCGEWVKKDDENFPNELKRFNWGAFLLNWIWGIMHKKYITLVYFPACIIPIIGPLAVSIWFGLAGNKWAWQTKDWKSIEEFNESQKFWVRLWAVMAALAVIITIKIILFFVFIGAVQV